MKIKRFNEAWIGPPVYNNYQEELESQISDIIGNEVEIEHVPYSSDECDQQISSHSRHIAAKKIIEYLKSKTDLNILFDSEGFNL